MSKARRRKVECAEQSPLRVGKGLPESHAAETNGLLGRVRQGDYEAVLVESDRLLDALDVSDEVDDVLQIRSAARAWLFRYEALVKRGEGHSAQAKEAYEAACDLTPRSGLTANMSRIERIRALGELIEFVDTGQARHLTTALHAVEAAEAHAELLRGTVDDENLITRQILECATVRAEIALALGDPMTASRCIVENETAVSIWEIDMWNRAAYRCVEALHHAYVTPDELEEQERQFRVGYEELERGGIAFDLAWYAFQFGQLVRSIEWLERARAGFDKLGATRLRQATEKRISAETGDVGPTPKQRRKQLLEAVDEAWKYRQSKAGTYERVDRIVIVGEKLQKVYDDMFDLVWKRGRAPLFLEGETGTGKGELALISHYLSGRHTTGSFVEVDFQDPETLVQDRMFGHKRGAWTGANADAAGLFSEAEGGTLFLDEIDKAPMDVLDKFLVAFDRGTYRKHGDSKVQKMRDVQLIFASSTPIEKLVEEKRMRLDMMCRIVRGGRLVMPSLRENRALIQVLARRFAESAGTEWGAAHVAIDRDAWRCLLDRTWKGNARELETIVRGATRKSLRSGRTVVMREGVIQAITDYDKQMGEGGETGSDDLAARLDRYPALAELVRFVTGTKPLARHDRQIREGVREEIFDHAVSIVGLKSPSAIGAFLGGVTTGSICQRLKERSER